MICKKSIVGQLIRNDTFRQMCTINTIIIIRGERESSLEGYKVSVEYIADFSTIMKYTKVLYLFEKGLDILLRI